MAAPKHQLRALLEQSCQMVEELAAESIKLVIEVQAIHYWTTHSLETLRQLKNIGGNLRSHITNAGEALNSQEALHNDPTGQKLVKTVYGLWRALPGLNAKLTEQLSRRRRQRIMGIDPEDAGEIPAEQIEQENADLRKLAEQTTALFAELRILAGRIPAEVVLEIESEGSQGEDATADAAPEQPQPAVPESAPPAAAPPTAEPDEMSPV